MDELKPCPFCDIKLQDYYEDGRKVYHPYNDCLLAGDEWWIETPDCTFKDKWNRRKQ